MSLANAARPDPRFSAGDVVQRVNQPEAVGVVRDVRWDRQAESWNYSVQFGAQLRVLPEESLESLRPMVSPWDALLGGTVSGARHFVFTLTYHRLRRPPTRIAYSFSTSRTQFYPHQFTPLLKFLDHPGKRLLIADDVGLGKTIEAGYILRELRARQVVERVLVVVPARLVPKWKRELQTRFDEPFDVVRRIDLLGLAERLRQGREIDPFRWIISYEHVRPEEVRAALEDTQPPIDVLIVDEVHRLRNPETLQHRVGATLCRISDIVLFLSATPVQNRLEDLWNLLRLLSPEEFGSWDLFQNQIDANRPLLLAQRALALRPARLDEATAQVPDGPYAKIDIGAGTTNASVFRIVAGYPEGVEEGPAVKLKMAFFGAESKPVGMDAVDETLARLRGWEASRITELRGREDSLLQERDAQQACRATFRGMHEALCEAWRQNWRLIKRAHFEKQAWTNGCKLFLIGGGSLVRTARELVSPMPLNAGKRLPVVNLESPPDLRLEGRPVSRQALPFVLVAYGLSVLAPPIPMVETPDEVPPMPPTEPTVLQLNHEDIYTD